MPTIPPSSAHRKDDLSGRLLGDYLLLRRLGQGAMAEVYLAEQRSLRRQVAFKVLKPELATDERYVKRFHVEAQAAAGLVHANIVQIHEVGCVNGTHFIAQEYVPGRNLREILDDRGVFDAAVTCRILIQVSAALQKAAEHRIVHRDIKPENIMLSDNGEVKVADFGLARLTGQSTDLTQIGITMGTPLYMSPEQVEGKPLDPRSDIYSLGVTTYQVLAGKPPFSAENALGVAVQHLKEHPEPLSSHRADLPEDLCAIVHKMLAKNPDERFAGGRELMLALRSFVDTGQDEELLMQLALSGGTRAIIDTSPIGNAATQQLQTVMSRDRWSGTSMLRRVVLAGVMLAAVCGAAVGWSYRDDLVLPRHASLIDDIPQFENGSAQLYHAKFSESEAAWKSVLKYYGDDEFIRRLALQQLAIYYLERSRLDEALATFEKLANEGGHETIRAYGLAGMCIVHHQQGNQELCEDLRSQIPAQMHDRLRQLYPQLYDMYEQISQQPIVGAGGPT